MSNDNDSIHDSITINDPSGETVITKVVTVAPTVKDLIHMLSLVDPHRELGSAGLALMKVLEDELAPLPTLTLIDSGASR